jgi:hypothetical protein
MTQMRTTPRRPVQRDSATERVAERRPTAGVAGQGSGRRLFDAVGGRRPALREDQQRSGAPIQALKPGLTLGLRWAYLVIADGRLYIRDADCLWCFDIRAAAGGK